MRVAKSIDLTHILIVGAGGIGSEFIHILLGSSFTGDLAIVDMDLIEISNLNRQTFFTVADLGQNKAEILSAKVNEISNGRIRATAYPLAIEDPHFSPQWIEKFGCVVSCLDNIEGRECLNRLCFLAGVPIIESGSAGFLGQVQTIVFGQSECYVCRGPNTRANFPVCTIRGRPTNWHHCVHWTTHELIPVLSSLNFPLTKEDLAGHLSEYNRRADLNQLYAILTNVSTPADLVQLETIHQLAKCRAFYFAIEVPSVSETQNIIDRTVPSIITTNTIIGSLISLALKDLCTNQTLYEYYLTLYSPIKKLTTSPPAKDCPVCSCTPLRLDFNPTETLHDLLAKHGLFSPTISVVSEGHNLVYDEEYTANLFLPITNWARPASIFKLHTATTTYLIYLTPIPI
ncbi:ubiquitin-like 1-activating enzyme E1 B [Nematocida homosporus]|uniref:ubiquitin-like 1-activating enzyme E1 B n=1 Tax=Nematocida homosporus TaxID=1912981 RepID=UPI0022211F6F|nr:ubiquitin-like 1-activating enzyme E1 B [Nematocida homosporus]KAI5186420.1 ubiquitin-like 1-activating enzyme E1 B [Nematocida homosporus]